MQRNVVRRNGTIQAGEGLDLGFSSAYRENTISRNALGTVSGGIDMGANSCDTAPTCP